MLDVVHETQRATAATSLNRGETRSDTLRVMPETAERLVRRHLDAVNTADLDTLLDSLADDAVWTTGRSVVRGRADLTVFFTAAFEGLRPRLALRSLVAGDGLVACELTETATIDGTDRQYPIAGFYSVRDGRITEVCIYREGSAELL
jgi:uncharacterized protein